MNITMNADIGASGASARPGSFMERHGPALTACGYPILPIMPGSKVPGHYSKASGWRPAVNWQVRWDRTASDAELFCWSQWPDAGVGVPLGLIGGFDIDLLDQELAAALERVARRRLGNTPVMRVGRAPKSLLVYKLERPFRSVKRHPVEFLAHGSQFVAYAIHPTTQLPYSYPHDGLDETDISDLPVVTEAQVHEPMGEAMAIIPPELRRTTFGAESDGQLHEGNPSKRGTVPAVRRALEFIPNGDATWDEWTRIGMAIKGALGEEGRDLFLAWSAQSAKDVPEETVRAWAGFRPKQLGAGTLYDMAKRAGWRPGDEPHLILNAHVAEAVKAVEIDYGFIRRAGGNGGAEAAPEPDQPLEQDRAASGNVGHRPQAGAAVLSFRLTDWSATTAFTGEPPTMRWLVGGSIPLGVTGLIAGSGGIGKSYSLLELAMRVAWGNEPLEPPIFGGLVQAHGAAVFITAEDSRASVHRRIAALDPDGRRRARGQHPLLMVPLPDAGGPFPIVTEAYGTVQPTPQFEALRAQLLAIPDLRLVVLDPLQTFAMADINSDPKAAQLAMSLLAALAAETGATILIAHHVRKTDKPPHTLEDARQLIRGTTALVDAVRVAIALWAPEDAQARKTCQTLGVEYAPNKIARGGVVKSNDGAERKLWTLLRRPSGLLRDVSADMAARGVSKDRLIELLVEGIARAARDGRPFTKTGDNGLYTRRAELAQELHGTGRNRLEEIAQELLQAGRIVAALAKGTTAKWLDIPGGPFATGNGEFAPGAGRKAA